MCTGMATDILGNQPQNHPQRFPGFVGRRWDEHEWGLKGPPLEQRSKLWVWLSIAPPTPPHRAPQGQAEHLCSLFSTSSAEPDPFPRGICFSSPLWCFFQRLCVPAAPQTSSRLQHPPLTPVPCAPVVWLSHPLRATVFPSPAPH